MNLKPFDLDKAIAGESVITRLGYKVTQLTFFDCSNEEKPFRGVVKNHIYSWEESGKFSPQVGDHELDLFMDSKIKKLYIAVSKDVKSNLFNAHEISHAHESLDSLKNEIRLDLWDFYYIKEIEIEQN